MRRLRILLAASLVLPALLFTGAVWQERRLLMHEAARRVDRTAEVLEEHTAAAFHAYELIFARVDEHLRTIPDEDEAARHAYLASIDHELKEVGSLFLVDAAGRVTAHSRFFPVPVTNVSDRDYFRMLAPAVREIRRDTRQGAGDGTQRDDGPSATLDGSGLAVGVPNAGRFSGNTKLNIARATVTSDGRFEGAISISVAQDYFGAFQRKLSASPDDSMALIRADGSILTRSPSLTSDQMGEALSRDNSRAVLTRLAGGVTTFVSPIDHIERISSYRKLADYPIYVGYGLSTADVLRPWRVHLVVYGIVASIAASMLSYVTWLALQAAQDEARARVDLVAEMGRREVAETALRQAQKMESVGQLTGGIAHDFNNLLAAVLGNLELLAKRLPDDPRLRRYVDGAIEGARRGASLTQRMLAFSRRQELRLEAVDLSSLVRDMADLLVRSIGPAIRVETRFPVRLAPAHVDANQLESTLLNLVVNARDAMPGGGDIVIGGRAETVGPANPQGLSAGHYVVLVVSDTGEGMDATTLARATEPFFTTKVVGKGTGLGLAMVHGLAAQSGGTLRILSTPGQGTTVEVWLPVSEDVSGSASEPPPPPVMAVMPSLRVLLVDDDPLVLASTSAMLEDLGHVVSEVDSAQRALEVLRAGKPVDIVITDQMMPGMTGLELASEIDGLRPGLPMLLASGFAELSEVEAVRLPRLSKPFSQATLAHAILDLRPPEMSGSTVTPLPRRGIDAK